MLHLATHGFAFGEPCARAKPYPVAGPPPEPAPGADPLLCTGLALAGANTWLAGERPPDGAENGILTAAVVYDLDLLGTELMVLSACATGLGEYHPREGTFGLRRACEIAGARSVLVSIWDVPSEPTVLLMREFYRTLLRGHSRVLVADGGGAPCQSSSTSNDDDTVVPARAASIAKSVRGLRAEIVMLCPPRTISAAPSSRISTSPHHTANRTAGLGHQEYVDRELSWSREATTCTKLSTYCQVLGDPSKIEPATTSCVTGPSRLVGVTPSHSRAMDDSETRGASSGFDLEKLFGHAEGAVELVELTLKVLPPLPGRRSAQQWKHHLELT